MIRQILLLSLQMTVTAYLCRLTLGRNALADQQERVSSETAEANRHALELRSEVERSEAEVLATVGFYNAPDIKQGISTRLYLQMKDTND